MRNFEVLNANQCVAKASYNFIDIACVYPITPSTEMAEMVDKMSYKNEKNLFGQKVFVREMQSEAGCIGMLHGVLTSGALASTYTCSQGLLLMIPEMYRISSCFLPGVIHVSSRSVAKHALSIMGDHSDVYSCRQTGWAMICSSNVQESYDFAIISHLSSIDSSYPFLHFFDGFRTSHEIRRVNVINQDILRKFLNLDSVRKFRNSSLNPSRAFVRGSNQGDDIYFQCCEAGNYIQDVVSKNVINYMNKFNNAFGTNYHPFDFYGSPDAEYIIIAMGAVCDTIEEVIDNFDLSKYKIGLIKVRLFRPFVAEFLGKVIPKSAKIISVLDKTKESGSIGEPLYLDVLAAINDLNLNVKILRGRYGVGGKNTSAKDIFSVFENMFSEDPKKIFTIGITDNIYHLSLNSQNQFKIKNNNIECKFFGLGSDGMIGAVKNISAMVGKYSDFNIQYYPQYDSKKSGGLTISHFRFGKDEIKSEYYIEKADYLVCSQSDYVFKYDFTKSLKVNSIFLLNSPDDIKIPRKLSHCIKDNNVKLFVIDANKIAKNLGLKSFYGIVMQGAFLKICDQIKFENKLEFIKSFIESSYYKKNPELIKSNIFAFELSFKEVREVSIDDVHILGDPLFLEDMNDWPVSKLTKFCNGNTPCSTSSLSSLNNNNVPHWIPENCSQCGFCSLICPHSCIRIRAFEKHKNNSLTPSVPMFGDSNFKFSVSVSKSHCTGCSLCVNVCPGIKGKKALEMVFDNVKNNNDFEALDCSEEIKQKFKINTVKGSQFRDSLMRFSSACPGCGETAYVKLLTQLFGPRLVISNSTGCSSIWGGNFGNIPYTTKNGFNPAWQNSLFENSAEFGIGMYDAHRSIRDRLLSKVKKILGQDVENNLREECFKYIETFNDGELNFKISLNLTKLLEKYDSNETAQEILSEKEYLSKKSFWIIGGDGWAYDIGFGGLDHVIASGEDINILVLDTEIYSNTGGQCSKSTPKHASVSFDLGGKTKSKKNLSKMMMLYDNVYVSQVSLGANLSQCVNAFYEAEKHNGPSLIVAYSPCIGHGIKGGLSNSINAQKLVVNSGHFELFRFNPTTKEFMHDSKQNDNLKLDFFKNERRFEQYLRHYNQFEVEN